MVRQHVSTYRKQGFLHLRGVFSRAEVETVRRDAIRVFAHQLTARGEAADCLASPRELERALYRFFRDDVARFANCGKQVQHLLSLHRLSLDARILDLLGGRGLALPNTSTAR